MDIAVLAMVFGIGAVGVYNSLGPILAEQVDKKTSEITGPMGYEELSNQVVDPRNIISNPNTTQIVDRDVGPFGIPRNIHDIIGDYRVITFGNHPGLQNNI